MNYKLVKRPNPRNTAAPPRYYAQGITQGKVDIREIAEMISEKSTLTTIDILAVVEALLKSIPRELAKGSIVNLGEFGSFWLTIHSEGSELPEDFNQTMIKGTKLNFRPGKLVKNVLDDITFVKVKAEPSPQ